MTTAEPHVPHPDENRRAPGGEIPAADGGLGAPPPAPGHGVEGEEPDTVQESAPEGPGADAETPFRTPVPPER